MVGTPRPRSNPFSPVPQSPATYFSDTDNTASDHSANSPRCRNDQGTPPGKGARLDAAPAKNDHGNMKHVARSELDLETSARKLKEKQKWPLDETSRIGGDFSSRAKLPRASVVQETGSSVRETSSNNNATTSMEDFSFTSKPGSGDVMRIRSRKYGTSSGESSKKRNSKSTSGAKNPHKVASWRSMSPAMNGGDGLKTPDSKVEVGSSALMIGETVSAVRQMRTEAAILAFRLAEVHAQDAQELRQAASAMRNHVDSLHDEVQGMQVGLDELEKSRWSWKTALREVGLFTAVMGAAVGAEEIARWIRNFASGSQQNSKNTSSVKGGVMGLAALVLVGARYKSPEWAHMAKAMKGNEQERQSLFEKWRAIIHRVAVMTSLAHSEPTSSGRLLDSETLPISNGGTPLSLTR